MSQVEWVEVRGKDVDIAVAAAVEELGLAGPESAEIEVIQQSERGFLGMGGKDAIVRVKPKPSPSSRRRRGGRGRGQRSSGSGSEGKGKTNNSRGNGRGDRSGGQQSGKGRSGGKEAGKERSGADSKPQRQSGGNRQQRNRSREESPRRETAKREQRETKKEQKVEVEADRTEQAAMVQEFLTGLLAAFGLEGDVKCVVEEDIIIADVSGEQTEALVGPKGSILQSILELSRTIVQRKSQAGARIRLDIAGYGERRREALRIYTGRLVEKIMAEGGEIMLEPMNPADRKVVHDAAADLGGVRTYSEGEEPRRSVVIAKAD